MNFRQRMQQKLISFMSGRHGNDDLNRFMVILAAAFLLFGLFFKGFLRTVINTAVVVLLVFSYVRMLSRNNYKRMEENNKYLRIRYNVFAKLKMVKERWVQRKDYKFFTCPSCHAVLRVPKGKGKINIVCRKCGKSFIGKS